MSVAQKLHAATSAEYTFQYIEGVRGLKMPIFRVSLEYIMAKHPGVMDAERMERIQARISDSSGADLETDPEFAAFLSDALAVGIDIVEAGAPEFAGRIHITPALGIDGRPLECHFTVHQLGPEFMGMLSAIMRLSVPVSKEA